MSDDVEVAKLTRERDEMRALLDKFERHMAEVKRYLTSALCTLTPLYSGNS